MNDEWIRRGAVAFMGPEGAYLVPIFQRAVALLEQSIQSPDVDVIVCERKIAPHERGYRLELREAMLIHPFGRPPLTGILICADDLKRLAAPVKATAARAGAGRKPVTDWDDVRIFVVKQLEARGDPEEADQVKDWRSKTDVATAARDYVEGRGEEPPGESTMRRYVSGWLDEWRSAQN